jgi:hypothetical protein
MSTITLQNALDTVESLPDDDQRTLVEIIKKRLIEKRRDDIARNRNKLYDDVKNGTAKSGSLEDLLNDCENQ